MSLNDTYLRKQISKFRQQINKIFWFMTNKENEELSNNIKKLVTVNKIQLITFESWEVFWNLIENKIEGPDLDYLNKTYIYLILHSAL